MTADLQGAYANQTVLVTGHTGFKGAWLSLWLHQLKAKVVGYSLPALANSMFVTAKVQPSLHQHHEGDIRDLPKLIALLKATQPKFVFHLAAQALVKASYENPLETMGVNAMGTATLLEAIRQSGIRCAVVIVSSDKCYENREWVYGYREEDALGGHDVYSMSKGATELVTASWRRSFFAPQALAKHGVAVASARAGNVIGGGDWAENRIVPDCIAALKTGKRIAVRNPSAVRPWQHVLEPLGGYLLLGAKLVGAPEQVIPFCEAFNFGPAIESSKSVAQLTDALVKSWGSGAWDDVSDPKAVHEAGLLRLSIDKANAHLRWAPRWGFDETIDRTVAWYRAQSTGATAEQLQQLTLEQLAVYQSA